MLHFIFDQGIRDPQDPLPPARPDLVYRRLEGQYAGLDVPLEYLALPRNDAGWWAGGKPHRRPEHAALAALTAGRSIGVAMEGTPALTWMHAASRRALTHPDRPWAVGAAPARWPEDRPRRKPRQPELRHAQLPEAAWLARPEVYPSRADAAVHFGFPQGGGAADGARP
ncbi:hypothetical protein [Rhodovibrio sodomensis]|uniref:hypothetical protein n=1 Tax=Rhodovibrio sodomensis TaxID=1088 RepID=UPI001907BB4D|nr:hypothetical protein [Rhodovibrio sodomensis]